MLDVSLRLAISMNVKAVEPLVDVEALARPFLPLSCSLNSNEPNRFLFFDDPLS